MKELTDELDDTKYIVIRTKDLVGLCFAVNNLMKKEWKPIGGMIIESDYINNKNRGYLQTLIKD